MAKTTARTIYVLNGPNLNLLGTREPHIYGRSSLKDVEKLCRKTADAHGFSVEFRQSNHEGVIVDWIQEAGAKKAVGIVFNPGGLTHTSVACHDAIKGINVPTIECHISNIHAREPGATIPIFRLPPSPSFAVSASRVMRWRSTASAQ